MARCIYEVKLKERFFPAQSEEDAVEMQTNGTCRGALTEDEVCVSPVVKEEDTMKLFVAAKAMSDLELFSSQEIEATIRSLVIQLGYCCNYVEIADCVLTWVDRFSDMSVNELQEWIIG